MNLQRFNPFRPKAPPTPRQGRLSGRPTYASTLGGASTLQRAFSFALMAELYQTIPAFKEAIAIYAGLVGTPELTGETDEHTAELTEWRDSVRYGRVGTGLTAFLQDHLGQGLLYGFGVGEAEVSPRRDTVSALWSYASPAFQFKTDAQGELSIIQGSGARRLELNPDTAFVTPLQSLACDPRGQSLFLSVPTVGQIWSEALFAHRSTLRRIGIPVFHIHTFLQEGMSDPEGAIANSVAANMETEWNESMRSQVEDGRAKDFYTSGVGDVVVRTIGADGKEWDITISKRTLLEEIVVATGIPPFLFGYAWSTTERMSNQQADKLTSRVDSYRRSVEPAIRKVVDLRERLTGRPKPYLLTWCDVSLQDAVETATAALADARAKESEQKYAFNLWRAGIWDQEHVAEYLTGSPDVADPGGQPPEVASPGGFGGQSMDDEALKALVTPRDPNRPLPGVPGTVEITETDVRTALAAWDAEMPEEYRGLLNARVVGGNGRG